MRIGKRLHGWLLRFAQWYLDRRDPNLWIGDPGDPYLLRWWVIPRNRVLNVYLHCILRSDDDRALHDHPWPFVSIILRNGYVEHRFDDPDWRSDPQRRVRTRMTHHGERAVVFRLPRTPHRLQILPDSWAMTLVITGPVIRPWGFWCPQGWRDSREYAIQTDDSSVIGRGCE